MQIQIAKRQLSTFNQQLKDLMLMQGLSADYNEIMNRVEESRLEHEKRLKELKLRKIRRDKELKETLHILFYISLVVGVGFVVLWLYSIM